MNKIYRLLWSDVHNAYVVAPETTKGHKKRAGASRLIAALALVAALAAPPAVADDVEWATAYPSYI